MSRSGNPCGAPSLRESVPDEVMANIRTVLRVPATMDEQAETERGLHAARAIVGDDAFAAAWEDGVRVGPAQVAHGWWGEAGC